MARKSVLYDSKVNGYLFSETFFYEAFQHLLHGFPKSFGRPSGKKSIAMLKFSSAKISRGAC
jgi:hypothetical protein